MMGNIVGLVADDSFYGIGAAIVIAIAGFAYTVYNGVKTDRRSTMTAIEQALNTRIDDLVRQVNEWKEEANECAKQRAVLEREQRVLMQENIELQRQIRRWKNGNGG